MKKRFRFTMDLEVEMKGQVCGCYTNSDKISAFLEAFVKDDKAILERYKIYLLCDLQYDVFIDNIRKSLGITDPKNDDRIYTSVLETCPDNVKAHFLKLFDNGKAWDSEDFEVFLDHLGGFQFKGASLEEVTE